MVLYASLVKMTIEIIPFTHRISNRLARVSCPPYIIHSKLMGQKPGVRMQSLKTIHIYPVNNL